MRCSRGSPTDLSLFPVGYIECVIPHGTLLGTLDPKDQQLSKTLKCQNITVGSEDPSSWLLPGSKTRDEKGLRE